MAGKGEKKRNMYSVELEPCALTQTIRFHSSIVRKKKKRKQLIPCCNQLTSYYLPEFINFIYSFLDLPRVVQLRGHSYCKYCNYVKMSFVHVSVVSSVVSIVSFF